MTTTITTTPEAGVYRETLPAVTCHAWCSQGDGHPDEVNHEDQSCTRTVVDDLRLTAMPLERSIVGGELLSITLRQAYVEIVAAPHSTRPLITLGGFGQSLDLTGAEARQLGTRLLEAADLVEGE